MQPYKLSGQRTWINCPWWIRTTITGSKDRCPAIGRRGSGKRKLVQKLHRDNARRGASDDATCSSRHDQRRDFGVGVDPACSHSHDPEYCGSRSAHSVEETGSPSSRQQRVDLCPPRSDHRLEIVYRVLCRRFPVGEHLRCQLRGSARCITARLVDEPVCFRRVYAVRGEKKLNISRRKRIEPEQSVTAPPSHGHRIITDQKRHVGSEATSESK